MERGVSRMIKKTLSFLLLMMAAAGCGGGGAGNVTPEAQFTMSTDMGSFPLLVAFDASASSDSDGTIAQYEWDFGDGTTESGSITQHLYTAAGTYTARLTVTDDGGGSDTLSRDIDGYICDDGEACGAYISLDKPITLDIVKDMSRLDFVTDLNVSLPTTAAGNANNVELLLQHDTLKKICR